MLMKKKKFLMCGKCDRYILGILYGAFGESSWSVYEYLKPLRVNGKSMKCLRSVKILCSHFFDASTSFTFLSGYLDLRVETEMLRTLRFFYILTPSGNLFFL